MANRRILTVSELAEHLNVHRITIYRLLKIGNLPGFKIGRVWRFDLDEIGEWMSSGRSSDASSTLASNGRLVSELDGHLNGNLDRKLGGNIASQGDGKVDGKLTGNIAGAADGQSDDLAKFAKRPQIRTQLEIKPPMQERQSSRPDPAHKR